MTCDKLSFCCCCCYFCGAEFLFSFAVLVSNLEVYELVHSRQKLLTWNMSFLRLQLASLGQFTRFEQVSSVILFRVELLAKDISKLLEAGSQESCLDPMQLWHGISESYHSVLWYESLRTKWCTSKGQWTWTQSTCLDFPFAVGCLCCLKWAYSDPTHDLLRSIMFQ